jgi:hypothetical protein
MSLRHRSPRRSDFYPKACVSFPLVLPFALQDRLARAAVTFAFWLCLEISNARHVAADRALDVLGLDALGTLAARNASQHALQAGKAGGTAAQGIRRDGDLHDARATTAVGASIGSPLVRFSGHTVQTIFRPEALCRLPAHRPNRSHVPAA